MSSVDLTEWSDFSLSWLRPARATAPRTAFAVRNRIFLRGLYFSRSWLRPARATAPQTAFAVRNRITPYLRSAIFPALAASRRAARATAPH